MANVSISLVAFGLLVALAVYKYIVEPAYIGPLSRIPNAHWSSPFSRLWINNARRLEQETPVTHARHQELGPIVRLAPTEISVNSVDGGIRTIYAGGYEKGDWYKNVFNNYGLQPMFSMPEHARHSQRKRMLSNIYAKSTLQTSASMHSITKILLHDRLVPRLRDMAREGEPTEFYFVFSAITMDFVSAYIFGLENGANYTQMPDLGRKFFHDYKARQKFQFWSQDVPKFTKFLSKIGLLSLVIPKWVSEANNDIEDWIISMQDKAEKTVQHAELEGEKGNAENWPNVYSQLRNAMIKDKTSKGADGRQVIDMVKEQRLEVASEMLDHTLAGFDTSSITLTFLAFELSLAENISWQDKLRHELADVSDIADAKAIDSLPILNAIWMETLRLHAPIPGNQPRITPPNAQLGPHSNLPPNIRVQAQAWSLHRNPEVFPEPERFDPSRWLDHDAYPNLGTSSAEQLKEMHKWFWAFGSGGRMCVGSNLAILDSKAIIAGIWANFRTKVINGKGMVHKGAYVADPVGREGKYLILSIEELERDQRA